MHASIYPLNDETGGWAVECNDRQGETRPEKALFYGPRAEEQARRYLAVEYGEHITQKLQPA
jgi:hypothetical protein